MHEPLTGTELLGKIGEIVTTEGGKVSSQDALALTGTLTAIKSKWFLGGRKVTDTVICRVVPESHEVHLRETAIETSWGLPPPAFQVETQVQSGARVTSTRVDRSVGGGGRLEFGRFRDAVARIVTDAGWAYVYEVP